MMLAKTRHYFLDTVVTNDADDKSKSSGRQFTSPTGLEHA